MPGGIGPLELVIVLVIVLVIFGPKRLPGLGRQLGGGMREFKDSLTGKTRADEDDDEDEAARPRLNAATAHETEGSPAASAPQATADAKAGPPAATASAEDADRA